MTLPLTRPPQRSSGPPGWRGWLARRAAALPRQWAAALCAALEREWMAGLLAGFAVFACVVAAVSASPPQRMWGTVAAAGYGLAALVALAGAGGSRWPPRSAWPAR